MNIPQNLLNQGKLALQSQWSDTATVSRLDENSRVIDDFKPIYTDIKCHLSQNSLTTQKQGTEVAETTTTYTLYVDSESYIKQGDKLIIKHKSQVFEGVAGEPFNREFSNSAKVEVVKIS